MTTLSQEMQTLIDDEKLNLSDGFYTKLCNLNKQVYEKETNNLFMVKYFIIKYVRSELNTYITRYIENKQILPLTENEVQYILAGTENGSTVSISTPLLDNLLYKMNIDLAVSCIPLEKGRCFCSEDGNTEDDSISICPLVRILCIVKY